MENDNIDFEETKVYKMTEELNEIVGENESEINESPIDILFDETNNDPIYLYSEKGEFIGFEQIALIPLRELVYVILKPIKPMDGIGENEGLVFEIKEDTNGKEYLKLVVDEKIIDDVFVIYDDLCSSEPEDEE